MLGDETTLSLSPLCNVYLDQEGRMCIASTAHLGSGASSIQPTPETLQMLQWMVTSDLNLQAQMATSSSVQQAPPGAETSATLTNRVAGNILRVCNLVRTKGDTPEAHDEIILPVKNILEELALLVRDPAASEILTMLTPFLKEFGSSIAVEKTFTQRFSNEETWATLSPSVHFLLSSLPSISDTGTAVMLSTFILELAQSSSFLSWALEEDMNLVSLHVCPCITDPLNQDPELKRPQLAKLALQVLATLISNPTYSAKVLLSQSHLSKTLRLVGHIQHPSAVFFNVLPRIAALSPKSSQLGILTTWLLPLTESPNNEGLKIIRAVVVGLLSGPGLPAVDLELVAGLVRFVIQADVYTHQEAVEICLETLGLLCADPSVPPLLSVMKFHTRLAELVRSPQDIDDRAILAIVGIALSAERKLLIAVAEGIASRPTRGPIMKEAKMILVANAELNSDLQRKLQSVSRDEQKIADNDDLADGAQVGNQDGRPEDYEYLPYRITYSDGAGLGEYPIDVDPLKLFKSQSPFADLDYVELPNKNIEVKEKLSPSLKKNSIDFDTMDHVQFQEKPINNNKQESPRSKASSSMIGLTSPTLERSKDKKPFTNPHHEHGISTPKLDTSTNLRSSQNQTSLKKITPTTSPIVEIREQPPEQHKPSPEPLDKPFYDLSPEHSPKLTPKASTLLNPHPTETPTPQKPQKHDSSRPRLPTPSPPLSQNNSRTTHTNHSTHPQPVHTLSTPKTTTPPTTAPVPTTTTAEPFTHRQPAQSNTPPRVQTVQHKHSQRGSSRTDSDREREELETRLAKLEQSFRQTLILLGESAKQESVGNALI